MSNLLLSQSELNALQIVLISGSFSQLYLVLDLFQVTMS